MKYFSVQGLSFLAERFPAALPAVRFLCVILAFRAYSSRADDPLWKQANQRFQFPLFSEKALFSENAKLVADRCRLTLQSKGDTHAIWAKRGCVFLGGRIAELRLFGGKEGEVQGIEANLINKGDFFDRQGVLRAARALHKDQKRVYKETVEPSRKLEKQMKKDFKVQFEAWESRAQKGLTSLFGKPERETFKQGRRRRVDRWDWRGVSFLLDEQEDEYLILRIMTVGRADSQGKGQRTSDSDMKRRLLNNVKTAENGDVWIANIPMVDQGEKGYCAVASAERLLRYFSVPVDSHELARLAGTDKFEGTPISGLIQAMQMMAMKNRRTYKRINGKPSTRALYKFIRKGVPIVWRMYVTSEMEAVAARRQKERKKHSSEAWKKILRQERRETRRIHPDREGGHIRLIVGCNRETDEIAYSDSWGRPEDIYWITDREAVLISKSNALGVLIP